MKKHIPNFITLLNLASGFVSIIFVLNDQLVTAVWIVMAAMVFDFLDGLFARLLKAYSPLGRELDSLADVVSFGVVPGLIMYILIRDASGAGWLGDIALYVPVIIPVLSGLRLAIFNLDDKQTEYFKGLPTPANAFFIYSLVLAGNYSDSHIVGSFIASRGFLLFFTVAFSALMVTRIRMLALKFRNIRLKGNELRLLFIISCILLFVVAGFSALPMIFFLYITVSIVQAIIS